MPSCQHTEIKTEPFIERNFHHPANELLGMSHAELELTREEQLKVSASSPRRDSSWGKHQVWANGAFSQGDERLTVALRDVSFDSENGPSEFRWDEMIDWQNGEIMSLTDLFKLI